MGNLLSKRIGVFNRAYSHSSNQKLNKKVVVITGCDSGLGYSLSLQCHKLGLTVVSGCQNALSEGAKNLTTNRCRVYHLDVTDLKSVRTFFENVQTMITKDGEFELHALVNNAGVMIFGEFEWYTEKHILKQIEVNMIGCFLMTKTFLPLLRKHKGRLINITSHCAAFNLPALTVYGATKAAVQSWSEGLRMEQAKYGVKIINFIPGSFATQSNIMSQQQFYAEEMEKCFSGEDKQFYGEYFKNFNSYLNQITGKPNSLRPIEDNVLYEKFTEALMDPNPRMNYKRETWRYFFYYNLFRITPFCIQSYLVQLFMKFPQMKKAI